MPSNRPALKVDWCSHEAATFAVLNWHYSHRMPKSKLAKLGVWENQQFSGAVIFGVGATAQLVKAYGLRPQEGCELVRVAMRSNHVTPVSRVISICIKILCRSFPGLRLVVSFADPEQGHHGGIYQAGGWIYAGTTQASDEYIFKGKRWQGRAFRNKYKGLENHPSVKKVKGSSKHRYLMPLDLDIRQRVSKLSKPYPKRAASVSCTPGDQPGRDGSQPIAALHSSEVKNGRA